MWSSVAVAVTGGVAFATGVAIGIGINRVSAKVFGERSAGSKRRQSESEETDEDDWESEDESEEENELLVAQESSDYVTEAKGPMKMILVVRNDLKMGKGKAAAQCAHAALAAFKMAKSKCPAILRSWESNGQPKIVLKTETEEDLVELVARSMSVGVVTAIIRDAGRTQIAAGSKTVVAVGPGPEKLVDTVTGHLKLY